MEGLPHLWPFAQAWDSRAPSSTHAPVCSTAVPRPFSGSENVVRKGQPQESSSPGGLESGMGLPLWGVAAKRHCSTCPQQSSPGHLPGPLRAPVAGHCRGGTGSACCCAARSGKSGQSPPWANTFRGPAKPAAAGGTGTQRGGGTSAWDSCRLRGNVEGMFSFIRHSLNKHLQSAGLGSGPPHPVSGALDVPVTSQHPPGLAPSGPLTPLAVASPAFLLFLPRPPDSPFLFTPSLCSEHLGPIPCLLKISLHH